MHQITSLPVELLIKIFSYEPCFKRSFVNKFFKSINTALMQVIWNNQKLDLKQAEQDESEQGSMKTSLFNRMIRVEQSLAGEDFTLLYFKSLAHSQKKEFESLGKDLDIYKKIQNRYNTSFNSFNRFEEAETELTISRDLEVFWRNINVSYGWLMGNPEVKGAREIRVWMQENPSRLDVITKLDDRYAGYQCYPTEISQFQKLTNLSIVVGNLKSLPHSLLELTQLTFLSFSDTARDKGEIPSLIFKMTQLQALSLSNMKIKVTSKEILSLPNLTYLDVSGNKLGNVSEVICRMKKIKILNLAACALTDIPNEMKSLDKLEILKLEHNQITTFSKTLLQISALNTLCLSRNSLSAISEAETAVFTQLTKLELIGCELTSVHSIPKIINLTILDLSCNSLSNLPPEFCNLRQLTNLLFSHNQLKNLPNEFSQLQSLVFLGLNHNLFETIPDSIIQITSLSTLEIGSKLTKLPEKLVQLPNLTELVIRGNEITEIFVGIVNKPGLTIHHNYRYTVYSEPKD